MVCKFSGRMAGSKGNRGNRGKLKGCEEGVSGGALFGFTRDLLAVTGQFAHPFGVALGLAEDPKAGRHHDQGQD